MELWLEIVLLEMLCRWDSYPLDMKDWYWLRLISPSSCSVVMVWDCGVTFLLLGSWVGVEDLRSSRTSEPKSLMVCECRNRVRFSDDLEPVPAWRMLGTLSVFCILLGDIVI